MKKMGKGRMKSKAARHVYIQKGNQSKDKCVKGVAKQEPNVVIPGLQIYNENCNKSSEDME